MAVDISLRNLFSEVVSVRTGAVDDPSELARASHRRCKQLRFAKAAVFHKHKFAAAVFGGTNERRKLIEIVSTANLASGGNPRVQYCDRYLYVRLP